VNSCNRSCYGVERSIATFLERITSSPSTSKSTENLKLYLNLRLHSVKLLSMVSEIQEKRDAFWDRGSRAVAAHFRDSTSPTVTSSLSSEEKRSLATRVYRDVRGFCLDLVEEVKSVDKVKAKSQKSSEKGKGKLLEKIADGEGFLRFLENWSLLSRKSASTQDLDLIAGLIYGTSSQVKNEEVSSVVGSGSSSPAKRVGSSPTKSTFSSSPVKQRMTSNSFNPKDQTQATKYIAHTSAVLTKVVVSMDNSLSKSEEKSEDGGSKAALVESLEAGVQCLGLEKVNLSWISMATEDSRKRWFKNLGQTRRRAWKIFDREFKRKSPDGEDAFTTNKVLSASRSLLEAIVSQYELYIKDPSPLSSSSSISSPKSNSTSSSIQGSPSNSSISPKTFPTQSDLIEDSIHILRTLSQAAFKVEDFDSYEESRAYLERGFDLVASDEETDEKEEGDKAEKDSSLEETKATSLGFLASSLYFLGGQLFAKKRIGSSIPFIKRACEVSELSNRYYSNKQPQGEEELKAEETRTSNLTRRYEHLACAYHNVQQSQLAFENYLKAIISISDRNFEAIEKAASENGISQVFEKENDYNRIGSSIKSAIEVSVFLLLMDQRVDLKSTPFQQKDKNDFKPLNLMECLISRGLSKVVVGALLEWCLIVLDFKMQQEEAPAAINSFIENLEELYDEEDFPIRKARILLRKIEIGMFLPDEVQEDGEEVAAALRGLEKRRKTAEQAMRLLNSDVSKHKTSYAHPSKTNHTYSLLSPSGSWSRLLFKPILTSIQGQHPYAPRTFGTEIERCSLSNPSHSSCNGSWEDSQSFGQPSQDELSCKSLSSTTHLWTQEIRVSKSEEASSYDSQETQETRC